MKNRMQLLTVIILAACLYQTAVAQENAPPAPPPPFCENNPGFDDFDFWVGEWNVYSNDENRIFAGTNSITKHYNNCLVKEQWESPNGGGFSVNFYNPVRGQWRQVWVSNGYSIDYAGGLDEDGAMVMKGEIDGYQSNSSTPFRGKWTVEENEDVIQRFETYGSKAVTCARKQIPTRPSRVNPAPPGSRAS